MIEPDGMIHQAEMTSCGLNGEPLKGEGCYPAAICCNLTNGKMPHLSNTRKNPPSPHVYQEREEVFVKDITEGTLVGYKYFQFEGNYLLEVVTRGMGGQLIVRTEEKNGMQDLGSILLEESSEWKKSQAAKICVYGKKPLYLIYEGKGKIDFLEFHLQLYCKSS